MKSKQTKDIVKKIIAVLLFLLVFFLCTLYIMRTTKDKANYIKYQQFYEENENFDVLFFGSSRILDAVYPMELWDEYKLTSYNMAQHSEGLNVSYWQMKNAFEHNTPKVAVVDLSLLRGGKIGNESRESLSYLHKSLDHIPFSKLKYDALVDLTEGVDIWEYMVPYAMYHNRWNDLDHVDFYMEDYPLRKGAESRVFIRPLESVEWSSQEIATFLNIESIRLQEMVTLCEEYGVELVFTLMPTIESSANPDFCSLINAIQVFADENGIPLVNFAKEDDFLNYATDFSDTSHLNPSGGKKLTSKMGQFLVEKYCFETKNEMTVKAWEQAWNVYMGTKLGELMSEAKEGDLNCYMMLLNDEYYKVEIHMPEEHDMEQLGLASLLEDLDEIQESIVYDMKEQVIEIMVYREDTGELLHQAKFAR